MILRGKSYNLYLDVKNIISLQFWSEVFQYADYAIVTQQSIAMFISVLITTKHAREIPPRSKHIFENTS